MLPGLRTPNAPQREDTADALFDQIPKGRGQQVKRDLHAPSWKHVFSAFGWAVVMAWMSWVTFELLSEHCAKQPRLMICLVKPKASVLGKPSIIPSTPSPDDVLQSRISSVESRVDMLENVQFTSRNFAAGGDGAMVFIAFTSPTFTPDKPATSVLRTRPPQLLPSTILDDSIAIGRCWEFAGQHGHVGIGLTEKTHIRSISLNHAHASLMTSASAQKAPRAFALWGLYSGEFDSVLPTESRSASHFLLSKSFPPGISANARFVLLVNSSYDTSSSSTRQIFEVPTFLRDTIPVPTDIVILEISSNWGAPSTCVYSVGIHGEVSL